MSRLSEPPEDRCLPERRLSWNALTAARPDLPQRVARGGKSGQRPVRCIHGDDLHMLAAAGIPEKAGGTCPPACVRRTFRRFASAAMAPGNIPLMTAGSGIARMYPAVSMGASHGGAVWMIIRGDESTRYTSAFNVARFLARLREGSRPRETGPRHRAVSDQATKLPYLHGFRRIEHPARQAKVRRGDHC